MGAGKVQAQSADPDKGESSWRDAISFVEKDDPRGLVDFLAKNGPALLDQLPPQIAELDTAVAQAAAANPTALDLTTQPGVGPVTLANWRRRLGGESKR